MEIRIGNGYADKFLSGFRAEKYGDRTRRRALQQADRGLLTIDPFVLKMAVQLSNGRVEPEVGMDCVMTLLLESWGDPAVIADVTCALTNLPSPWIFLDQLVCTLQDRERRNDRITFNTAAGILAGTLLSCGRQDRTWISYHRRIGVSRPRSADESLAIAIVEAVCTWPIERVTGSPLASVLDETRKLIDSAIQEYVNPGQEQISVDTRNDTWREIPQPQERELAIARIWELLREHSQNKPLNPVGAIFLDKFSHRLLGRLSAQQRAEFLPHLAVPPEAKK